VNRLFQLAALVMVLLLGAAPVIAAVACPDAAMAAGSCHCTMKAEMSMSSSGISVAAPAVDAISAAHACCEVGTSQPSELFEPKASGVPAALLLQMSPSTLEMVPASSPAQRQARLPMADSAPSPAHLCTFLI